jgi:hypothetical protein
VAQRLVVDDDVDDLISDEKTFGIENAMLFGAT